MLLRLTSLLRQAKHAIPSRSKRLAAKLPRHHRHDGLLVLQESSGTAAGQPWYCAQRDGAPA